MSTAFQSHIDMANRMIKRKGQTTVITQKTPGTKDPVSQEETGESTTTTTTKGVFIPPGMTYSKAAGGLVRAVNHTIYISPKGLTINCPKSGDVVTDKAGQSYVVDSSKEWAPDGTPVLWEVYAKLV